MHALISIPTSRPLTHVFLDAPGIRAVVARTASRVRPDLILAYCSGMARFAVEHSRRGIPFVLDMVDVDSEKWRELGRHATGPRRLIYTREARTLGAFEVRACSEARTTLVVNDRERRLLESLAPTARVQVLPIGIDLENYSQRSVQDRTDTVVFCGVFDYLPNVAGAQWLAREVWPIVRRRRAAARLVLVGANPADAVRALALDDDTIRVTGSVPDVRPYLWGASVAAAPLQLARGVQTKVLEAVAAGLPTVITSAVAGGLPAALLPACRIADRPEQFAHHLVELLAASSIAREAMLQAVDLQQLSWSRQLSGLRPILERAAFGNEEAARA